MTPGKTITIIGAGYVGLTTAVLLANAGGDVCLIDIDKVKIAKIKSGKSPFYEAGLDELVTKAVNSGKLKPLTDYSQAVPGSDFVFCCVGTPDRADGSSNLDYVFDALQTAAAHAKNGVILIQKSTVPVDTGQSLISAISRNTPDLKFHYVSNPEFLREGSAVRDSLYPDRTVLGGTEQKVLEDVAQIYKHLYEKAGQIMPIKEDQKPPHSFIYTTLESAELIKVTANAFLALKISFANSIAKLSDRVGADINEIMNGIGQDKRIGRAFLNAGRGYGGGCFPKDVSGLIATAAEYKVDMEIMSAAVHVNESMVQYIIDKIEDNHQPIKGAKVAVLGLSFKPNTSDTRRSPAIILANLLAERGAQVMAYDPEAILENHHKLHGSVRRVNTLRQAIEHADTVVIATDWDEFKKLDFESAAKTMDGKLIIDCMNALEASKVQDAGLTYMGVGRY